MGTSTARLLVMTGVVGGFAPVAGYIWLFFDVVPVDLLVLDAPLVSWATPIPIDSTTSTPTAAEIRNTFISDDLR